MASFNTSHTAPHVNGRRQGCGNDGGFWQKDDGYLSSGFSSSYLSSKLPICVFPFSNLLICVFPSFIFL
jgi:hypothetical protein